MGDEDEERGSRGLHVQHGRIVQWTAVWTTPSEKIRGALTSTTHRHTVLKLNPQMITAPQQTTKPLHREWYSTIFSRSQEIHLFFAKFLHNNLSLYSPTIACNVGASGRPTAVSPSLCVSSRYQLMASAAAPSAERPAYGAASRCHAFGSAISSHTWQSRTCTMWELAPLGVSVYSTSSRKFPVVKLLRRKSCLCSKNPARNAASSDSGWSSCRPEELLLFCGGRRNSCASAVLSDAARVLREQQPTGGRVGLGTWAYVNFGACPGEQSSWWFSSWGDCVWSSCGRTSTYEYSTLPAKKSRAHSTQVVQVVESEPALGGGQGYAERVRVLGAQIDAAARRSPDT